MIVCMTVPPGPGVICNRPGLVVARKSRKVAEPRTGARKNPASPGADANVSTKCVVRTPLSLVVLPFENLGGNPQDDYLADGITDDLTTDLSRIPDAFVIARKP